MLAVDGPAPRRYIFLGTMYLGIEFLISPQLQPFVGEVNVGLPGGAEEYDRTHRVVRGRPSGVFETIETISESVYGMPFAAYLDSLPFLPALKEFKLWLDGRGGMPANLHPALRLEDKWVQYQALRDIAGFPETIVYEPGDTAAAGAMLARWGRLALKRRLGRGGRGFRVIEEPGDLPGPEAAGPPLLLQRHIDSRTGGFALSVRAVAVGGRVICAYANLAAREFSNHGVLAFVAGGSSLALSPPVFRTERFDERSWEARLWFGGVDPVHLRHNLSEDEVAEATLTIPRPLLGSIEETAVRIERHYEGLDWNALPPAFFEGSAHPGIDNRTA